MKKKFFFKYFIKKQQVVGEFEQRLLHVRQPGRGQFVVLGRFFDYGRLTFLRLFLSFYGVGFVMAQKFAFSNGVPLMRFVFGFDAAVLNKLNLFFKHLLVGEQWLLLRKNQFRRKLLVKTYQSLRFKQRLPMRGQRTHSNAGSLARFKFPS